MTARRLGCGVGALVATILIGLVALADWTPPPHPVHTVGAREVSWRAVGGNFRWDMSSLPPSTSLQDLRCQAWQRMFRRPCPEDAVLARQEWPGLDQSPHVLYVPYSGADGYRGPQSSSTNFEYLDSSRTITVQVCDARPLFFWSHSDQTLGAQPWPTLSLLAVRTDGITPGPITVVQKGWIERITGDQANGEETLGTAEIS